MQFRALHARIGQLKCSLIVAPGISRAPPLPRNDSPHHTPGLAPCQDTLLPQLPSGLDAFALGSEAGKLDNLNGFLYAGVLLYEPTAAEVSLATLYCHLRAAESAVPVCHLG